MTILDPDTGQEELRGGATPWRGGPPVRRSLLTGNFRCDVLIVGAGITGAMLAEHLAALGHDVCIVDRERPGFGSTLASTSLLMWEIDASLAELAARHGFERAATIYRRSLAAVADLRVHASTLGLALRPRRSLYLAGDETPPQALMEECELRRRAGLPSEFLDRAALRDAFGIERAAAIVSDGSADADPAMLSNALMRRAVTRGARLFEAEASAFDPGGTTVGVELEGKFVAEARHVVLATGYVMPGLVKSDLHDIVSTFALATVPRPQGNLWRDGALIWEATKNYFYARTTVDGRIIIGGEDEQSIADQEDRDRMLGDKTQRLLGTLRSLWPQAEAAAQYRWSGAFGTTKDGLPLIGPVPRATGIYAAYGYGGNGITFSFLASRMIGACLAGRRRDWFDDFALDRAISG